MRTTRRLLVIVLLAVFPLTGINACYKMGKATGEATEDVKEGGRDFKKGYQEGKK